MQSINPEISQFGYILLFIIGALLIVLLGLSVNYLLSPSKPNAEKLAAYECGEEPVGSAWGQFNIKFYIIALIFLVFEVEIVFLFPWATVFGNKSLIEESGGAWGWYAVTEAFIFIGILILGLIYIWKKGFLDWIKPEQKISDFNGPVPKNLYDKVNQKYSGNQGR